MLKTLTTLVKIHKHSLDEKRKELSAILDRKESFLNKIKMVQEDLENEIKISQSGEVSDSSYKEYLLSYIAGIKKLQIQFKQQAEELEPQIIEISNKIAEKFAEMKKYEIMKDIKIEEMETELKRKDQLEIDAIAIEKFIRKEMYE